MSTTRIFTCFERTTCTITQRGQNVWKRTLQGAGTGFGLGAAVGALTLIGSEGFRCDAMRDKMKEYPGCSFNTSSCSSKVSCANGGSYNLTAVAEAGSAAVHAELVYLASFALPLSAASGFVAGALIGALSGMCEALPPAQPGEDEDDEAEMSITVEKGEGQVTKNKDGATYTSIAPKR